MTPLALLVLITGCLAPPEDSGNDNTPDPPKDPPPVEEEVDQAFFILQQHHLQESGWPSDYAHYRLFVCNPSLPQEDVDRVRADVPGAKLIAYTSAMDVPIDSFPESPYFAALAEAFPQSYCIRDLNTGNVVHVFGHGTDYAVASYIPREPSIQALVNFHANVTMQVSWDGFYVDQCNAAYPNHRKNTLLSITDRFDVDANNIPDSMELLVVRYAEGRPLLTQKLRERFPAKIIVANSGGALGDPALNGLCLEGVGDRFTIEQARTILSQQRAVSRAPFHAVLWNTSEPSEDPSWILAEEQDGVYFGVVEFVVGAETSRLRRPTLQRIDLPEIRVPDDRRKDPRSKQTSAAIDRN